MGSKRYCILAFIFWGLVVLGSYMWNLHLLGEKLYNQSVDRAQFVFKMIESTRLWNARHGGVYVKISDETQPNKYLKIENRDINSVDGMHLTMINPAYMTRQLIDVVTEPSDLKLHITSDKLMNPINKADEWESKQLEKFKNGVSSFAEFIDDGDSKIFRYMQPLKVDSSCLRCHSHQGYSVGDVRGGVSVTFSVEPLLELESAQSRNIAISHLIAWLLLGVLSTLFIYRFRKNIVNLELEKIRIEELVSIRTKELQKFSHAIHYSPVTIVITDKNGAIEYVNPKFSETTGYSYDEAIGQNPRILQSGKLKDGIYRELWETILDKQEWRGELLNRTKDGTEYWEDARISPILDSDGEVTHFVAIKEDVTLKKLSQEKILYQARHDALTGLVNRKYFHELLSEAMKKPLVLLYLDLDGFKMVNDTLGHDAGDLLLLEVAKRLSNLVRSSDVVARLGGDEFVIMMRSGASIDGAKELAEKVLASISTPFDIKDNMIKISTSIGISISKMDKSEHELLKEADIAMYDVKESGRNNYKIYGKN